MYHSDTQSTLVTSHVIWFTPMTVTTTGTQKFTVYIL